MINLKPSYNPDDFKDGFARDGAAVRVAMGMMDSRTVTPKQAPAARPTQMTDAERLEIAQAQRDTFWARHRAALEDAWKGDSAPALPSWADSTPPWARAAAQRPTQDAASQAASLQATIDRANAHRDAAFEKSRQTLADAWQGGR